MAVDGSRARKCERRRSGGFQNESIFQMEKRCGIDGLHEASPFSGLDAIISGWMARCQ